MNPPSVRVLEVGDKPSAGFVRRKHPVIPEFISHFTLFPTQEWEKNGEDTVYLWVPAEDNRAYERFVPRKRYCPNYKRSVKVPTC